MATAKDNLFPKMFKIENKKGAPVVGLIISALLTSGVMFMSLSKNLIDQFEFISEIVVFSALLPYLFTSAAYVLIIIEKELHMNSWIKTFVLGGLGFAFSVWAVFGTGSDTVFYGFLLVLTGIPFYLLMQYNKR